MVKLILFVIAIAMVMLLSGCVTYYTKVYTIDEPPEDLHDYVKVVDGFHDWELYLKVICAYEDSHSESVELDSCYAQIMAEPSLEAMISEDSIWIDSVSVTLTDGVTVIPLEEYNRRKWVRDPCIYTYYRPVQIPDSNDSVDVQFTIHLIKKSGEEYQKRWEGTLYRYEKKVKGLPLD